MKMSDFSSNIKDNNGWLLEKLENFIKSQTVVGEPIKIGEVTIIPLVSASFGLGSGSGDGTTKGESGSGVGSGIAAKISPLAVLVVKENKTELITLKNSQAVEKLVDKIPDLVSNISNITTNKEEKVDIEK
jgi:uncharacterized spore protein YtfJ